MALTNYSTHQFGGGLDFGEFGMSSGLPPLGSAPVQVATGSGESGLMGILNKGIGALASLGGAWLDYSKEAERSRYYGSEPERQRELGLVPDIQGQAGGASGNGAVVWLLIGAAAVVLLLKVQKG